ncbi:MAG: HU family DNA-binding protein [Campylobacterales bacterium]
MNKQELVSATAERSGLKPTEAKVLLDASLQAVFSRLMRGESVTIRNFGTFSTALRKKRRFFNPFAGALMESPDKIVVTFKAAKALSDRVNGRL